MLLSAYLKSKWNDWEKVEIIYEHDNILPETYKKFKLRLIISYKISRIENVITAVICKIKYYIIWKLPQEILLYFIVLMHIWHLWFYSIEFYGF